MSCIPRQLLNPIQRVFIRFHVLLLAHPFAQIDHACLSHLPPCPRYVEAEWMLNECKTVIAKFRKRLTDTLAAQRKKDLLEMVQEKNREPCVQGEWHKMPYTKREYRLITAYGPASELDPNEAIRVMKKLETSMTRQELVDAVDREDRELQQACDATVEVAVATTDLKKLSNASASTSSLDIGHQPLPTSTAAVAALDNLLYERHTVEWDRLDMTKGDIVERDTWGIDCYTRKNIELALGLVPAPLTMTRGWYACSVCVARPRCWDRYATDCERTRGFVQSFSMTWQVKRLSLWKTYFYRRSTRLRTRSWRMISNTPCSCYASGSLAQHRMEHTLKPAPVDRWFRTMLGQQWAKKLFVQSVGVRSDQTRPYCATGQGVRKNTICRA